MLLLFATALSTHALATPQSAKLRGIAAGDHHSLFLKRAGTVVATGFNRYGQLGDGSTTDRHRPVRAKVPQWKIKRGDWTQIMCHNGGKFDMAITASSHFESSNTVEASAEIGMEMKLTEDAAPFGVGVSAEQTVSATASAAYARMWGGGSEHGITTTVHCPTSGCLFQYQMRMYQEYGSGTCHWKTQMTTCTKNTAPPGCPPFIPDCKLVGAYMVTDNLQASANAPRVTAFACAFVTMVAVMGAGAAWQRARRRKALASEEVVDEMLLVE